MTIQQIDPAALQDALKNDQALIIDVREVFEYEEAYIHGAVLVPMGQCHPQTLPCNPDKMLVFQCKKGGRSQRVCELYHAAFPDRTVYNLAGGIEAWVAEGFPVHTL